MPRASMPDVIVLLPGILGSVLQKDGVDVWAPSAGGLWRALTSLGGSIQSLRIGTDPADADDLGDGITASRLMPDVHLIPGLWKIDGYSKISAAIQENFQVELGQNFFEFPYDWRRDNRVAARKLDVAARDWLHGWRQRTSNPQAKLILIGHSMGGLVARYFLECREGWQDTRALITFGTPYRGAPNALNFIANGLEKKLGPITMVSLSDLLRSLTSVYQLLPIYACVEGADGRRGRPTEVQGIPHLDAARALAAREQFHEPIRAAVEAHQQRDEYRQGSYVIHPIVGVFQPTLQSARLTASGDLRVDPAMWGDDQGGDGTVPRVSATPVEVRNEVGAMFAAETHGSLQNYGPVIDHLRGVLTGLRLHTDQYFATGVSLRLELADAFTTEEPVELRVRPDDGPVTLVAECVEVSRPGDVRRTQLTATGDGMLQAQLGQLPEGTYRVTVHGDGNPFPVQPVTDVFAVVVPAA